MLRYVVPLLVFLGVAAFLLKGLELNPHEVPSPLSINLRQRLRCRNCSHQKVICRQKICSGRFGC